jgi:predicted GNAT family acetyltransferase
MSDFRDNAAEQRFEQDFDGGQVFADYATSGDARVILHVEAEPQLRGTGAADKFMASLAAHARAEGLKLKPRCSYAVVWLKRHREHDDLVAD